ncbi:YecH family metal-binding protein [Psychromonas hadalis]|uniref:YecH family metal-binding protein n=1 Tax=Psychromonas hadalis TaxID=211669 RepID=UPI0003B789D3|nr:YecH family metal-binding protein [Psychromonas hadalis]
MSESIHGHQVMEMMATAEKSYSKEALKAEIAIKFGEDARFHTCMGSDMTADDLIVFLASKGKFVESEQGIRLPKEHLC